MLPNNRVVNYMQTVLTNRFYTDTANYITRTAGTPDTYGEPSYSEATTAIACSFTDKASIENWREFVDVQAVDAEIRFTSPTPSKKDAITITGRFGDSTYTDKRFDIVGIKDRGDLGFVCALKAVDV